MIATDESQLKKFLTLKKAIFKIGLVLLIITLVTLVAISFKKLGFHETDIIITYLLGVLLVSYWIEGYLYGILASIICVLTFNFFFMEPYYSILAYRQDYPITFAMMLFAAVLTSTLTSKVKQEAKLSAIREKRAFVLYKMSQGLLKAQNIDEICQIVGEVVSRILNLSVIISIQLEDEKQNKEWQFHKGMHNEGQFFISQEQRALTRKVFKTGKIERYQKQYSDDLDFLYVPIIGQHKSLGVLGISLKPSEIIYEEKEVLIQAMTFQIGQAVERVIVTEAQKNQQMEIETERFRGNLLRAISHDLRTPLTGILGAATTILVHDEQLNKAQKKSLVEDIAEDANWLIQSVENILSMTRFDEGKVVLHLKNELVDDLILEALNRFKATENEHLIKVTLPDTLVAVEVDSHLIEQVLVNLVDNAIKYTPKGSKIDISVANLEESVVFSVSDYGKGISEDHMPLLFNRFFTAGISSDRGKNGIGLGLEICKSIVEAHGGNITAYNNIYGGACFEFTIPKRRD